MDVLTPTSFGSVRIGSFGGFTGTGFVYCSNPKLILISFFQSSHSSGANRPLNFGSFHERVTKLIFHLDNVTGNRGTAVSYRWFPFKLDHVFGPVDNLRKARSARSV